MINKNEMESKNKLERDLLLYQVARLYYEENMTQEQIAKETGFSRPKIQRLLDSAKKEGIVQVYLVNPMPLSRQIEEKLEKHFKLTRAIVISGGVTSEDIIKKNIGRAAARYLEETIRDNDIIGIGFGRTVYETINYFEYTRRIPITAVPLIGGIDAVEADFQVNKIAEKLAEKTGGTFVPFHVPVLVDNDEIVNALFSDENLGKVAKLWEKVTTAIIGIGGNQPKYSYRPIFQFNETDIDLLKEEGYVGDILFRFLRKDGKLCTSPLSKRVVGISPEMLKRVKRVIAIAGALRKKDVILAALRGEYIDVLVIDENVAKYLLTSCEEEAK